jgi:hypothetical protein
MPSREEGKLALGSTCMYVCMYIYISEYPPFQFFNQLTNIHEIWHEYWQSGGVTDIDLIYL